MIRCTIELLPGGREDRKRLLGIVEIILTTVSSDNFGEYIVVLKKSPPFNGALRDAWRRGRLAVGSDYISGAIGGEDEDIIVSTFGGHHRSKRGVYDLLYRALRACGLEARNL